jgi:hypothetical protein
MMSMSTGRSSLARGPFGCSHRKYRPRGNPYGNDVHEVIIIN